MNRRTMSWFTLCLCAAVSSVLAAGLAAACGQPNCPCNGGHKSGCATCNMGDPVSIKQPGIGPCNSSNLFSAHYFYDVTDQGGASWTSDGCTATVTSANQDSVVCGGITPVVGSNLGSDAVWTSEAAPNGSTGYPYSVVTRITCNVVDTQGQLMHQEMQNAQYGTYQCSNNIEQ